MYKIMFIVGLVFALLFLVISIILFVKNNVAKLIGDVTGLNARKAIKQIQEKGKNEKVPKETTWSGGMPAKDRYRTSALPTVDTMVDATTPLQNKQMGVELSRVKPEVSDVDVATAQNIFEVEEEMMVFASESSVSAEVEGVLPTYGKATTLLAGEETTLLVDEEATTLLVGEETTLLADEEATALLVGEETTLLADEEATTLLVGEATTLLADEEVTTLLASTE